MKDREMSFRVMVLVGVPAFAWLLFELGRVLTEVVRQSSAAAVPLDGVIQHKVGELMVGAPLFLILLLINKWPEERVLSLVGRTRWVMVIGGLLNALAWYSLREREPRDSFFRMWCLALLVAGLLGSRIALWMVKSARAAAASETGGAGAS